MKTIWKFAVPIEDHVTLYLPASAQVLCVKEPQIGTTPYIWAVVDPSQPLDERKFRWYGTGHQMDEREQTYVGTVFLADLVFHLFEEVAA